MTLVLRQTWHDTPPIDWRRWRFRALCIRCGQLLVTVKPDADLVVERVEIPTAASGELNLFNDRAILVGGRMGGGGRVARLNCSQFRRLLAAEPDIANVVIRAIILRRERMFLHGHTGVTIIAPRRSAKSLQLQLFLTRNPVHVTAATADLSVLPTWSSTYVAAHAAGILRGMLERGFTTVRDACGADWGLAQALSEGLFSGPRLLYCGKALSQTGGHGDVRSPGQVGLGNCACCAGLGRVADGVDAVRAAARDELRRVPTTSR